MRDGRVAESRALGEFWRGMEGDLGAGEIDSIHLSGVRVARMEVAGGAAIVEVARLERRIG